MLFYYSHERRISKRASLTIVRDSATLTDCLEHGLLAPAVGDQIGPAKTQRTAVVKVRRSDGCHAGIVYSDPAFELNELSGRSRPLVEGRNGHFDSVERSHRALVVGVETAAWVSGNGDAALRMHGRNRVGSRLLPVDAPVDANRYEVIIRRGNFLTFQENQLRAASAELVADFSCERLVVVGHCDHVE